EQLSHERRRYERVEVHVQPVKSPAQPGRNARSPLLARELAQARDLALLDVVAGRRDSGLGGVHAQACSIHCLSVRELSCNALSSAARVLALPWSDQSNSICNEIGA